MTTLASPSQTTARQLRLIDADIHHHPDHQEVLKRMPAALRKRGWMAPGMPGFGSPVGLNRKDTAPPAGGAPGSDPDYMLEHHFDALGIDFGMLHPGNTLGLGASADYRYAAAACSAYNDYMLETWLDHGPAKGRFLGAILVSPTLPEAAAKEVRRVGGDPRFKEVYMTPATNTPLGHEQFWPIYEAAEEMGLPVAVHPGNEGRGVSAATSVGYPSSYFEWHNILPATYMAQINSLVCEGVFQKFPKLMFVGVEGGIAWLAHLMWRMDKNWKALRELTPWLQEPPSAVIKRHIRLTTQPIEEPEKPQHLIQLFEMIDAQDLLLFSSDYPHWDFDDPRHAFPGTMPDDMRQRIFWKNAAELFGLNAPPTPPA